MSKNFYKYSFFEKNTIFIYVTLLLSIICVVAEVILIILSRNPISLINQLALIFRHLFFIQDVPASLVWIMITLFAFFWYDKNDKMSRLFCWIANYTHWLSLITFVICAFGAWFAYHTHPFSMDEYSAYFQSQIFARGQLKGQFPTNHLDFLIPSFFHFISFSQYTGAVASSYWPSLSLIMAPFSLLGVSWLCNPFLTAITIFSLGKLLDELITDTRAKGFALLATVASPVIFINGMSYYGMPLQLLCSILFALGMVRETSLSLLGAGFCAAIGLTTVNPVPFTLFSLPWLWIVLPKMDKPWRKFGLLALIGLPVCLVLGLGWRIFLIHNFSDATAMSSNTSTLESLSKLLGVFELPTAPLLIARVIALLKLCFWAVPCLPVFAFAAWHYGKEQIWIRALIASAVITFVGYLYVPFDQGHGWGYRYFHATWLALPLLAAFTLQRIGLTYNQPYIQRTYGFAGAVCIGMLIFSFPLRAYQVESVIHSQLQQIPNRVPNHKRQAVFVNLDCGFYSADLVQNHPFLQSNEIILVSHGDEKDKKFAGLFSPNPRLVNRTECASRWLL